MGVKVRFDGLDVMAMVSHLNHVALGRRVINIYEGDTSDAFLFKLDHNNTNAVAANVTNNSNNSSNNTPTEEEQDKEKQKLMLYLESGIRFHCTTRQNVSTSAAVAGNSSSSGTSKHAQLAPFVFQLRKHLRGSRLEHVTQLGQGDRVVHFVFGMGPQRRALLLELYARGNLILCDAQYRILALLRSHQYPSTTSGGGGGGGGTGTGTVQVQVGQVYPVTYAARNVVMMLNPTTATTTTADDADDDADNTLDKDQAVVTAATTSLNVDENNNNTNNDTSSVVSVNASSSAHEWAAWAVYEVQQHVTATTALPEELPPMDTANNNNHKKGNKKGKKDKQAGQITLKTLLLKPSSGISHYGPNFLEHCILLVDSLKPHVSLVATTSQETNNNLPSLEEWQQFLQVLQQESAKLDSDPSKAAAAAPPKGYILYSDKNKNNKANGSDGTDSINHMNPTDDSAFFVDKVLEEFQPYLLLKQHQGRKVLEFDTFNDAVDTFFGQLEGQRRLLKAEAAEQAAADRLEKIRQDQQVRLQGLELELAKVQQQAAVVEWNADNVEKALTVINSALDSGMDWDQLEQLVQVEQEQNQNPIALLIYQLDLEQDAMVLELPTADYVLGQDDTQDGDDEAKEEFYSNQTKKKKGKGGQNGKVAVAAMSNSKAAKKKVKKNHVLVTVSLKDSAHGNASQLFAKYRAMKEKSQRTVEASVKALKAAEETAQRQLADAKQRTQQATNTAVGTAKPPWFTKFHWFITSDNYLVLGGRDAHQNEVLVKKYLRPGDAYLHADVHGAASCILRAKRIRVPVKNARGKKTSAMTTQTLPLSDQALREAGNFTICRSSAWTSKMVTSAWWVESHQVSKTAPTGEYLTVGSFMIRGKKNFLPPTQLEMGLGVMFRFATPEGALDPATYARHKNDRRDFALMELLEHQEDDDNDNMNSVEDDRDETQAQANDDDVDQSVVQTSAVPTAEVEPAADSTPDPTSSGEERTVDDKATPQGEFATGMGTSPQDSSDANDAQACTSNQVECASSQADDTKKKKGLSVKERKLIKKYGSLEEAARAMAEREKEKEQEKEKCHEVADDDDEDPGEANKAGSMKRGRRGKKKKVIKKYANQDEEDRELAMLALQGGEKVKKTNKDKRNAIPTSEEQIQAAAETAALLVKDAAQFADKLPADIRSILAECVAVQNKKNEEPLVRWDKFDADVLDQLVSFEGPHEAKVAAAKRLLFLKHTSRIDNFSASLAGILRTIKKYGFEYLETELNPTVSGKATDRAKRKTKEEKQTESAEWKETLAGEGVVEEVGAGDDEDGDIDDTTEINKLTGKPHPEDALVYALPVCAPYQTLSQYTYRIKLTPGNLKRGKAAKQCVDMFLKGDMGGNATDTKVQTASAEFCRDLIKKVGDNDWIQTLCADVKISSAGASKATKKQKANTKAKAKKKN